MLQFFDTLADTSGNALPGATVTVTNYPAGTLASIYSSNGTVAPVPLSTVTADLTGQVSFYAPDGAYTLTYSYNLAVYKTRSPVQLLDPLGFVAIADSGVSANNYALASAALPASLYIGLKIEMLASHTNTGTSVLSLNGGATQPINQPGGGGLLAGMIQANGLVRLEWDGVQWQLIGSQSQPFYARSAVEIANGVVPTNLGSYYGALARYGADPTGAADSTAAFVAATKASADVFDDYPGGGLYKFNSEAVIASYPITIRGQARVQFGNQSFVKGTEFLLATAAGPGAACLRTNAFSFGLRLQNIGFAFQTYNTGQIGFRASQDLRAFTIENCEFQGSTTAGSNTIGMQFDGGSVYSGAGVIRDNYISACLIGIYLKGNCTTFKIYGNELYGNIGGVASGAGIQMDYPVTEPKILCNYFESFVNGIFSNGALLVQQCLNDFQVCTHGFTWTKTSASIVGNQSVGESGNAGVYSSNDSDQNHLMGRLGWLNTGGTIGSTRGFTEGNGPGTDLRTFAMGYPQIPVFSAAIFTGLGSMTWTVSSGNVLTFEWILIGKTMTVFFTIFSSTVGGTPSNALQVTIPGGFSAAAEVGAPITIQNNNAFSNNGIAQVVGGATVIQFFTTAAGSTPWTASANTGVQGSLTFPVN